MTGGFAALAGAFYFGLDAQEVGTYTIVCFVDEPEAIPGVACGTIAEFTVQ